MVKVLVLEDDPTMLRMVSELLEEEGYEPFPASNGAQAIELAGQHHFELVIVDVRMEGMDGLEALSRMQDQLEGAASLVMTGYASEEDSVRALRLGVGDYLRKPFGHAEFLETVTRLVARARAQRSQAEEKRNLEALSVWALGLLGEAVDQSLRRASLVAGVAGAAAEAVRMCDRLGVDPVPVETAVLVAGLRRALGQLGQASPRPEPALPGSVRVILDTLEERWDGGGPQGLRGEAIPLGSRIASLVLAGEPEPGVHDPGLLEEGPSRGGPDLRSLLLLGNALLRANDRASAELAFRRVLDEGSPEQAPEALLGLARLSPEPEPLVEQALGSLGPCSSAVAGRVRLEASLFLRTSQPERAAELLAQAASGLRAVGRVGEAARAALAAGGAPDREALELLLRPEYEAELVAGAPWLIGPMLEWAASGEELFLRGLSRLARNAPRRFLERVGREHLSVEARRAVAQALSGVLEGRELLEALAADADEGVRQLASRSLARLSPEARPPLLRIYTLGPMEVYLGEEPVEEWKTRRYQHVFAYLATAGGVPVVEDRLIEEFWPEDFEKGKRGVYSAVSAIRKALRWEGKLDVIVRSGQQLSLDPAMPRWHDYEELTARLQEARRAEDPVPALRRVVELYRGPFMEGCYMDWALRRRSGLEIQVAEALSLLARQSPSPEERVDSCRRLLELDPCSQEAHQLLMETYLAQGRAEESIRQFEACRKVLADEVGGEPSIELLRLYHQAQLQLL